VITALIVDDERLARVELRRLLSAHPEIEIAGEARNGEEALSMCADLHPAVLFLDIQMPGLSGFDVLEKIDDPPQVIFTTAYDQHAVRAFEVNALDYLLKPVAPDRLAAAIARLIPPAPRAHLDRIFVRDGERCWIVRLSDVVLLESEGNYTRLCFEGNRPLVRRSLTALQQRLDPGTFFRANRSQIVNLSWIDAVEPAVHGGFRARLRDGAWPGGCVIEISRRRGEELRTRMGI
jgi:two-component system LytT family response regulator